MFGLLPKIKDEPRVAIYVDSPYLKQSRGTGGGSRYEHDFEIEQHERLAAIASRFKKARLVLSYYDHPIIRELYPARRWTIRPLHALKTVMVQRGNGAIAAPTPEILIINGPSYVGDSLFAAGKEEA